MKAILEYGMEVRKEEERVAGYAARRAMVAFSDGECITASDFRIRAIYIHHDRDALRRGFVVFVP